MELEFEISTAQLGNDAYVVSVKGEADLHTAPELERALAEVLRRGGRAVALDLAEVGFIDSTALEALLRYQPRFKKRGGDLVLVSDDRRVLRTFEIIGLDRVFPIHSRLSTAVESLDGELLGPAAAPTAEST